MERMFVLYFSLFLLVVVIESVRHGDVNMCPKFTTRKNTIIRTKDSKALGARMISKRDVDSARECYLLCCEREDCTIGIMHYSHVDDEGSDGDRVERKCYLFDCKQPNVCTFVNHTRYAVIELHRTQTEEPKEEKSIEKCPAGVPVAMCDSDPCETASCPNHPHATCKPSFCGTCKAVFFDGPDRVDCGVPKQDIVEPSNVPATTVSAAVSKGMGKVNEEEVEINPEEAGAAQTENPSDTASTTEDPYAVHEWRHFLTDPADRNLFSSTDMPLSASSAKPFSLSNESDSPPKVYIEEVKYLDRSTTSIPLLIALIACIFVLMAVIWRLRCSGRGKLNKKFAVDDGDYLINGMYL